jgi:hypothetical protein
LKVIYHSSVQGISAQVASALHLGVLPRDRLPMRLEWSRLPFGEGFTRQEQGGIFLIGKTRAKDEIYILAYPPKLGDLVRKTAASAWQLMKTAPGEMVMVDCTKTGGTIPLKIALSTQELRHSYFALVDLVNQVEGGSYT